MPLSISLALNSSRSNVLRGGFSNIQASPSLSPDKAPVSIDWSRLCVPDMVSGFSFVVCSPAAWSGECEANVMERTRGLGMSSGGCACLDPRVKRCAEENVESTGRMVCQTRIKLTFGARRRKREARNEA